MIGILDIAKPQIFDAYLLDLKLVQIIFLTRKRQNVRQEVFKKTFVIRSQGVEAWLVGPGVCFAVNSKIEFEG